MLQARGRDVRSMCIPLLSLGPLLLLLQSRIVNGQTDITPDGALAPSITKVELWQPVTSGRGDSLYGSINGGTIFGEGLWKLDGTYDGSKQVHVASLPAAVLHHLSDAEILVVETLPLPEAMQRENQQIRGPIKVCAVLYCRGAAHYKISLFFYHQDLRFSLLSVQIEWKQNEMHGCVLISRTHLCSQYKS